MPSAMHAAGLHARPGWARRPCQAVQLELHGGAPRHLRVHIYIVMIP
eukprot:COSAG02_NODE_27100_length_617_cov_0.716216_1_plen_46_part_10